MQACTLRPGWVRYSVQPGDTLFSIARRARVSLSELQAANCILDPTRIYVGQGIVVPPGSLVEPPPATPALVGPSAIGCTFPGVLITGPRPGATLRSVVPVTGAADIPNFQFFKLDIRPDNNENWANLFIRREAVSAGVLGQLDTTLFQPGIYWLMLTAVDNTGNYPQPCQIRVIIIR